jgi:hypothetical protein
LPRLIRNKPKLRLERAKYSNQSVRELLKPIPDVKPLEVEADNSDKQLDNLLMRETIAAVFLVAVLSTSLGFAQNPNYDVGSVWRVT